MTTTDKHPADYPNPGAHTPLRPAVTEQEPAALGEMTPADIEACVRENQIIRAELYAQGYSEFDKDGTLIPTDEMVRRAMSKPAAQGEAQNLFGWAVLDKKGCTERVLSRVHYEFAHIEPVIRSEPDPKELLAYLDREYKGAAPHRIVPLYTTQQPSAPGVVSDAMVEAACHFYHDPNNWLLLTESDRQNYRAMMRGAIDLAISAAPGAQPSADDALAGYQLRQMKLSGAERYGKWRECGRADYEVVSETGTFVDSDGIRWPAEARKVYAAPPADARDVVPPNCICHGCGMLVFGAPAEQAAACEYAAGYARDAEDARRYRWIRRRACIVATNPGAKFEMINLPSPTYVAPDAAIELDAAIDRAIAGASACESTSAARAESGTLKAAGLGGE